MGAETRYEMRGPTPWPSAASRRRPCARSSHSGFLHVQPTVGSTTPVSPRTDPAPMVGFPSRTPGT